MLPVNSGKLLLSDDSRRKLDLYYDSFCSGSNGAQYGKSHLIFACHAAFPLVLSVELCNLIWLNFKHYIGKDGEQKMDRVVVSDFLLSPLLRPVAGKQFELVPDIRNYLLFLLKDSKWFNLFGIESFGDKRLQDLANFLRQYLLDKRSQSENNASGFRQVNEWAALAYLEPNALAYQIAKAYKETFKENGQEADEHGQLRLNMLLDRFGQQLEMNIHEDRGIETFVNLHQYSRANKAQLFDKAPAEVSDLFYKLDDNYIANIDEEVMIELPIRKNIGERLNRKKNKIQKVLSLLIGIDEYKEKNIIPLHGCVVSAEKFAGWLGSLDAEKGFDRSQITVLKNADAGYSNIIDGIEKLYRSANAEDICLIYFAGHANNDSPTENYIAPYDINHASVESNSITNSMLQRIAATAKCQTVMLLDSHAGYYQWMGAKDIFMGGTSHSMQKEMLIDGVQSSVFFAALMKTISLQPRIIYKDLFRCIRSAMTYQYNVTDEAPAFMCNERNLQQYFLSTETAAAEDYGLLLFNERMQGWEMITDDFICYPDEPNAHILDYGTGAVVTGARGYIREDPSTGIKLFSGEATSLLLQNQLYKYQLQKPALLISAPFAKQNIAISLNANPALLAALREHTAQAYPLWNQVQEADVKLFPGQAEESAVQLFSWQGSPNFYLTVQQMQDNTFQLELTNDKYSWKIIANTAQQVMQRINQFAAYDFVSRLPELPIHSEQAPLRIDTAYCWQTGKENSFKPLKEGFHVDASAMFIQGETILFYPLQLRMKNEEAFPVFFKSFLLSSEKGIRQLSAEGMLLPGEQKEFIANISAQLTSLLDSSLEIALKLLISRQPILFTVENADV
ncbi:MAG: hypothetical protein JWQ27_1755 [Ferruginibacter sp.]|nr:hypothetical protein [Ferruginibacter sp.]